MKKVSLILSAVVMAAMMLSSCGSGASNGESASNGKSASNRESASNEVTIGNQVWMTKNLNVDKFRNGDPIPHVKTNEEWQRAGENEEPAWCYYNNDLSNGEKYGKLYNWYAVTDPRGLAPKGYHIPTDEDWMVLTEYLGWIEVAGAKMKSKSGWGVEGNGTNESGFSGLPGGFRYGGGTFDDVGDAGYWWSSTEDGTDDAWLRSLSDGSGDVRRGGSGGKDLGFSVRCLRD